jgi:hypothetical protein
MTNYTFAFPCADQVWYGCVVKHITDFPSWFISDALSPEHCPGMTVAPLNRTRQDLPSLPSDLPFHTFSECNLDTIKETYNEYLLPCPLPSCITCM